MFSVYLLQETSSGSGSIWVPVIVLGWFVLMTLVGSQVSRRDQALGNTPQEADPSHSANNPSEFDNH